MWGFLVTYTLTQGFGWEYATPFYIYVLDIFILFDYFVAAFLSIFLAKISVDSPNFTSIVAEVS